MSGGARRSRAPSGPPTVGSAPFGPLPESLWRSLARHARAYEDEGVALALVSLTVDLGWPENGTHVRYLLASVAAVVLGGVVLGGGRGGIVGPILAVFVLRLVRLDLTLLAVDPNVAAIVEGAIMVVVVMFGGVLALRGRRK